MTPRKRSQLARISVTPKEWQAFQKIAEEKGLSASVLLGLMIRELLKGQNARY